VDDLVAEMTELYGEPIFGARLDSYINEQWMALPFFSRANGHYIRADYFGEAGLDPVADTESYDKMRAAAMTVTDANANRWGWGMTVNRSGDGNAIAGDNRRSDLAEGHVLRRGVPADAATGDPLLDGYQQQ
jgi:multiple sugar transport system substrate-binding protein